MSLTKIVTSASKKDFVTFTEALDSIIEERFDTRITHVSNEIKGKLFNEGRGDVEPRDANELVLWTENDYDVAKNVISFTKNMVTKIAQGKYDHSKAPKLWSYHVERGAKSYAKQAGGSGQESDYKFIFSKKVRDEAAEMFADRHYDEIKSYPNDFIKQVPKKYQHQWEEIVKALK